MAIHINGLSDKYLVKAALELLVDSGYSNPNIHPDEVVESSNQNLVIFTDPDDPQINYNSGGTRPERTFTLPQKWEELKEFLQGDDAYHKALRNLKQTAEKVGARESKTACIVSDSNLLQIIVEYKFPTLTQLLDTLKDLETLILKGGIKPRWIK